MAPSVSEGSGEGYLSRSSAPPLPPSADAEGTLSRKGRGKKELPPLTQQLIFTTNVGDEVAAGSDHPLRFETDRTGGLKPYVLVRGDLWARLARPLLYELVDLAEEREGQTGVWSGGVWWGMG